MMAANVLIPRTYLAEVAIEFAKKVRLLTDLVLALPETFARLVARVSKSVVRLEALVPVSVVVFR